MEVYIQPEYGDAVETAREWVYENGLLPSFVLSILQTTLHLPVPGAAPLIAEHQGAG
ncbi:MAG: hypothetical protein KAR85_08065 [Methanosarcinales archaeon]|nr:hypothetical protein [Methanosarcinales archaeon]